MLCDMCHKNEAIVHYAEVINGEIKKLNICEQCAKNKGFGANVSFSLGDMLSGIIDDSPKDAGRKIVKDNKCPSCDLTYEEFKKSGRLGCDKCYKTFEKKLVPILDTIHKHTRHRGKVPKAYKARFVKIEKIRELNKKLREAVENEEFERAAVLRDKIRDFVVSKGPATIDRISEELDAKPIDVRYEALRLVQERILSMNAMEGHQEPEFDIYCED